LEEQIPGLWTFIALEALSLPLLIMAFLNDAIALLIGVLVLVVVFVVLAMRHRSASPLTLKCIKCAHVVELPQGESAPPNQPLHPTPTAAEAPASGAGERRR